MKNPVVVFIVTLSLGVLYGCGGSTDPELDLGPDFSGSALQVSLAPPTRQILFFWQPVEGATHYRLFQDLDGPTNGTFDYTQIGDDIPASDFEDDELPNRGIDVIVHLFPWDTARFLLQSCVDAVCEDLGEQIVDGLSPVSVGNFTGSASGFNPAFGFSVKVAESGDTIVIGAPGTSVFACEEITPVETVENECEYDETLTQEEIDDLVLTETVPDAGAVTILVREDDAWAVEALIKSPNIDAGDTFGSSVDISDDGTLIAVSAPQEDSAATGVDGDMENNDAESSGAVYIFRREVEDGLNVWNLKAYIKASNTGGDPDPDDQVFDGDLFGNTLALSGNGGVLAVAAVNEDSNAMGIDGDGADNSASNSGAVYVFRAPYGNWAQVAYIKAFNSGENDLFGSAVALDDAGNRLVVGAIGESSASAGIDPDGFNDAALAAGAAYVFDWNGSAWAPQAYIKSPAPDARDEFGYSVALNAAGDVLAVSAPQEDGSGIGVGADPANNDLLNAGAAFLYEFADGAWTQTEYFKASNPDSVDELGFTVALNETGDFLLATAIREGGNSAGINGGQDIDFAIDSGAGYLFIRDGNEWAQEAYIKAGTNGSGIQFGFDSDFALDGDLLAISSRGSIGNVFLY